jgi:Fur family ferric uptake transcriptional regulator
MKLLIECGIARNEKCDDGHNRSEVNDQHEHQEHLIGTGCGLVVESFNPFIEAEQDNIAHRFGFQLTHHSMRIFGVCSSCQQARQWALEIRLP